MSSVHSYTFDNLSRIGDDVCGISEKEMQNENFGSYSVQRLFRQKLWYVIINKFRHKSTNVFTMEAIIVD